ncbi:MAG: hypothetical protein QOF02_640 [Blastocatellia bacterium]|jgi:hypothetical protein|nr:hypothetical protein [Blastocatellia bacterium]
MHNCRRTESQFADLLFAGMDGERKAHLLTEIEHCPDCLSQYQSLSDTLFIFEGTTAAATPPEHYWPRYNANLRERLLTPEPAANLNKSARASIWKRLLTARLPVPIPVAAALVVCLALTSALAFRQTAVAKTQPAPAPPSSVKYIEIPVTQEKIVTRIIYVEKKQAKERGRKQSLPEVAGLNESNDREAAGNKDEDKAGFFTRANLKGFQPADDMKIRVLKRNNTDDK